MKVAHIITRMIVGGAQENTLLCCENLIQQHGDDVLLITGPSPGPEGELLAQPRSVSVPSQTISSLRRSIHPWHDWRTYRALKSILRSYQPDVVHTHSAKGGFLGRLAAWSLKSPAIIHTVHGAPFHPYQGRAARNFFRCCEKYAAKRCHALVSVADAMTKQLVQAKVAPAEKFHTIYSGMEVDLFLRANEHRVAIRKQLGFQEEHVVVGKIARLFHLKGHSYLIEAAQKVVRQHPQVRFLLIGDGLLRKPLEAEIRQKGLEPFFHFTGLVKPAEIPALIGAMDMLVHTSLREGLARALPQALLAGKPAISYDVDGAAEVVIPNQTGVLLAPQSVDPLAEAIGQLATDGQLRRQLGEAGKQHCQTTFSHEHMTHKLRELYQHVLSTDHSRRGSRAP